MAISVLRFTKRENALDVNDIKVEIEDDTDILVECSSDFKADIEINVLKDERLIYTSLKQLVITNSNISTI